MFKQIIMIPNTNSLICGQNFNCLRPLSQLIKLQTIPFDFQRTSATSFLYCNSKDSMTTNLIEASFDSEGKITNKTIEEFMGAYQYSAYGNDNIFLLNAQGDILLYNLYSKQSYVLQKQHPSCFSSIQIHNIESFFVTCGGNVKSSLKNNQKIIKIWQQKEGQIINSARIVTKHSEPIQDSFILGRNRVVTLSNDKTLRLINLATQEVDSIIPVSSEYYSGCPLDWNSALIGGTSKKLDVYDSRVPKIALSQEIKNLPIMQICQIARISAYSYILANVNQILVCDIRKMKVIKQGIYQGERVSKFLALSKCSCVLGNRDKTMQIWKFQ